METSTLIRPKKRRREAGRESVTGRTDPVKTVPEKTGRRRYPGASVNDATTPDRWHPSESKIPVKRPGKNLKKQYRTSFQIGITIALLVLVALFRIPLQVESNFQTQVVEQEIVQLEEIVQTEQRIKAPPPPRPTVPIEVPNDEILEDELLDLDVALDLDEMIVNLEVPDLPDLPEEEVTEEAEIFIVVEEMPSMIGGIERLYEYVEYPAIAREAGLEGTVVVEFVVEPDGSTSHVNVIKSVHSILDDAAVAAIEKLQFNPGKQRGKPVRVKMAIPIRFKLM